MHLAISVVSKKIENYQSGRGAQVVVRLLTEPACKYAFVVSVFIFGTSH